MERLLQNVRDIDQRTKDLVFGYARMFNTDSIIPMEICYICLLFYYCIPEYFVQCGKEMEIISSDENNGKINDIAQIKNKEDRWSWIPIQGNMIINPAKNPNAIIQWTVKINIKFSMIGIHSSYSLHNNDPDYHWYGASNYDDQFRKGDIIKMELNVPKRQLIYYKNDKLSKVAFDNIKLNKKYHLAITAHTVSALVKDNVELIDFDIKGHKSLSFFDDK